MTMLSQILPWAIGGKDYGQDQQDAHNEPGEVVTDVLTTPQSVGQNICDLRNCHQDQGSQDYTGQAGNTGEHSPCDQGK